MMTVMMMIVELSAAAADLKTTLTASAADKTTASATINTTTVHGTPLIHFVTYKQIYFVPYCSAMVQRADQ